MTYPPDVYTGDSGLVSAWLRPNDSTPELDLAAGGRCHYLATGVQTGGNFGLYRWEMGPAVGGPTPHFHKTITESFYVLDGEVEFFQGEDWVAGHAGDFVHVPEGGIHGFRNVAPAPASMLILFTPGAPREDYFETLIDKAKTSAMTPEDWTAFFLRHDTYWT